MRRMLLAAALAISSGSAPRLDGTDDVRLFSDDFSRFPPGLLSAPIGQLNGAIQEYHNDSNYRAMVSLPGWEPPEDSASRPGRPSPRR